MTHDSLTTVLGAVAGAAASVAAVAAKTGNPDVALYSGLAAAASTGALGYFTNKSKRRTKWEEK